MNKVESKFFRQNTLDNFGVENDNKDILYTTNISLEI